MFVVYFFIALVVIFVACILFYLYMNTSNNVEPPLLGGALPFIGNAYVFLKEKDSKGLWKLLTFTAADCLEKGGVTKVDNVIPFLTHYIIGDPDDLLVVASNANKHYFYNFFRTQLGNGIFTHVSQDEEWKCHRKQINVAFTPRSLENLMPTINDCGRALCDAWAAQVGRPFEHNRSLNEAVISAVIGDLGEECDKSLTRDYITTTEFIEQTTAMRLCSFPMHWNFIFYLTEVGRKQYASAQYINTLGRKIIRAKKEMQRNPKYDSEPKTVVDYVIQFAAFNDQELLEELNTVITAGFTTTASSLTSLFMLLGSHPDAQEKLYQELKSVFGTSDRDTVRADLARLPYLDAVVKESLRLYPAGSLALRYSDKPMVLKNYTLPAKRFYALNIYAANRHPIWGEDSNEFRPERWLEPGKLPPAHAFTSFNLGKRDCIGKNYAKMSVKMFAAHVVRRFKIFSDISKYELKIEVIIKPASGAIIRLEERNPENN